MFPLDIFSICKFLEIRKITAKRLPVKPTNQIKVNDNGFESFSLSITEFDTVSCKIKQYFKFVRGS